MNPPENAPAPAPVSVWQRFLTALHAFEQGFADDAAAELHAAAAALAKLHLGADVAALEGRIDEGLHQATGRVLALVNETLQPIRERLAALEGELRGLNAEPGKPAPGPLPPVM